MLLPSIQLDVKTKTVSNFQPMDCFKGLFQGSVSRSSGKKAVSRPPHSQSLMGRNVGGVPFAFLDVPAVATRTSRFLDVQTMTMVP